MRLTVERLECHPLELPFREVTRRNMDREMPHWRYVEVFEMELADGTVGYGENFTFYTWERSQAAEMERARGADATELIWADDLGAGVQTAALDAVGRALETPAHRLLGEQRRERVPISWWCIDMPPEDWVAECEAAVEAGYTDVKLKGRPWRDIRAAIGAISDATPESFGIDIDFNRTMLDAERAIPVLQDLAEYPQVRAFEEPISREDREGNRRIREAVDAELVHHYPYEDPIAGLADDVCDGHILSGGAREMVTDGALLATADKPFWLQQVGTDLTAAFSAHIGAVCERSDWPAINCHQLHDASLVDAGLEIEDGTAAVPEGPGLGVEVEADALERYRAEIPDSKPMPAVLIESVWPDGPTVYTTTGKQLTSLAREDAIPYFERGVETRVVPDDGGDWYREMYERADESPVFE